jgi:glutaredoxin
MIRIYTVDNCPYCTTLKNFLDADGIEYEEVNVGWEENQREFQQVYEITKSDNVPTIKIGKQLFAPNVSFQSIKEAYILVKKFNV